MEISFQINEFYPSYYFPSNEEIVLRLVRSYHINCEKFDRQVCTGGYTKDGLAMPMPGTNELARINRHASDLKKATLEELQRYRIPREEFNELDRSYQYSAQYHYDMANLYL